MDCTKRVLKYVCGTMDYNIMYKSDTIIQLEGYAYANWTGNKADKLSSLGFVFSLSSATISWSSKKPPIVALMSTKPNLVARPSPV